jgi:para-aminobenzoate synthetase
MFLIVHNGDSRCVESLSEILAEHGQRFIVAPRDSAYKELDSAMIRGVFLSAGDRDVDVRSPLLFDSVPLDIACLTNFVVPVLGICFGFQFIIRACGGRVEQLPSTVPCEPVPIDILSPCELFRGLSSPLSMWEFNTLEALELPSSLIVTARSTRSGAESVRHRVRPIFGTQFHPEAIVDGYRMPCGVRVITNFVDLCMISGSGS